jgi:hypothetical protein
MPWIHRFQVYHQVFYAYAATHLSRCSLATPDTGILPQPSFPTQENYFAIIFKISSRHVTLCLLFSEDWW